MKVSSSNTPATQAAESQTAKKSSEAQKARAARELEKNSKAGEAQVASGEAAKAEVSGRARDLQKAHDVAAKTPDVREEKIAELKRRIAAGQYKVDADAVADKMISEHRQSLS